MSEMKLVGVTGDYPIPKPWIFKPIRRFNYKLFSYYLLFQLLILVSIGVGFGIEIYLLSSVYPENFVVFILTLYLIQFVLHTPVIFILIYFYIRSFEYQVHGTEIVIKKGLINVTENHVPFTNVTNIHIRKGLLDMAFGIGSIQIHTAGAPENPFSTIKIEGIRLYSDVGHYIVQEIKKFDSILNIFALDSRRVSQYDDKEFWIQFLDQIRNLKSTFQEKLN